MGDEITLWGISRMISLKGEKKKKRWWREEYYKEVDNRWMVPSQPTNNTTAYAC